MSADGGDEAKSLLIWVIGMVAILGLAWFFTGGPNRPAASGGPFLKPLAPVDSGETYGNLSQADKIKLARDAQSSSGGGGGTTDSAWRGQIKIEKGSAASAIQPADEYIILKNISRIDQAVTITGWTLKNAGTVQGGSGILRGSPKSVIIPAGVLIYRPDQQNVLTQITLKRGERAIINSGKIAKTSPYPITANFKTNLCTGYFDRLPDYDFKPSLSTNCPEPETEPGINSLDDACFKFVKSLGRCETPEFKFDSRYGEELLDGKLGFSPACKDFLKLHYNYTGCLTFHFSDNGFIGKDWRVFLNTLPLWAKDRETIFLYDQTGRLVDSLSY